MKKSIIRYLFSFVLLSSISIQAFAKGEDHFFSKNLSQRELQAHEQQMKQSNSISDSLGDLSLIFQYRAFQEGNCKDVIEIEGKARQGDGESQWILADLYNKGLCVNKDEKEALKWIIKSSDNGYKKAFYDRALYHKEGIGSEKDSKLAFYWAKKSATTNDVSAYRLLSGMYITGEGTPANYKESLKWALKGAETGDYNSQALVATILASQEFNNPIEAYKWALLAKNSNEENIQKIAQEKIEKLESVLSTQQVQEAQNRAQNWKPKTQISKVVEFHLPKLPSNYSDKMTAAKALSELERLGIGKDRYLFFQAIKEDNLEVFKLFIKAGASIETKSASSFFTPLYSSITNDSKKIFNYLMSNGVEINAELNHDKDTPILIALSEGRIDMARRLIDAKANILHPGIIYNAVEFNDISLLQELYNLGATNIDSDYVGTPLMNSVSGSNDSKSSDRYCFANSTKFLLEKRANPNKFSKVVHSDQSVLMQSIDAKNPEQCLALLLQHGANVNYRDKEGRTALYEAVVLVGNPEIVKMLLSYGADKNDKYYLLMDQIPMLIEKPLSKTVLANGGTLLMLATSEGHISVVKELLESDANPHIKTKNGLTALSIAKENNNQVLIDLISQYTKKRSVANWWNKITSNIKIKSK